MPLSRTHLPVLETILSSKDIVLSNLPTLIGSRFGFSDMWYGTQRYSDVDQQLLEDLDDHLVTVKALSPYLSMTQSDLYRISKYTEDLRYKSEMFDNKQRPYQDFSKKKSLSSVLASLDEIKKDLKPVPIDDDKKFAQIKATVGVLGMHQSAVEVYSTALYLAAHDQRSSALLSTLLSSPAQLSRASRAIRLPKSNPVLLYRVADNSDTAFMSEYDISASGIQRRDMSIPKKKVVNA